MTEKVMILGADGMLGQLAAKFFAAKYEVIILNDRYIPSSRSKYIDKIIGLSPTAIINCVGKIKHKTSRFEDLIISNAFYLSILMDSLSILLLLITLLIVYSLAPTYSLMIFLFSLMLKMIMV